MCVCVCSDDRKIEEDPGSLQERLQASREWCYWYPGWAVQWPKCLWWVRILFYKYPNPSEVKGVYIKITVFVHQSVCVSGLCLQDIQAWELSTKTPFSMAVKLTVHGERQNCPLGKNIGCTKKKEKKEVLILVLHWIPTKQFTCGYRPF